MNGTTKVECVWKFECASGKRVAPVPGVLYGHANDTWEQAAHCITGEIGRLNRDVDALQKWGPLVLHIQSVKRGSRE